MAIAQLTLFLTLSLSLSHSLVWRVCGSMGVKDKSLRKTQFASKHARTETEPSYFSTRRRRTRVRLRLRASVYATHSTAGAYPHAPSSTKQMKNTNRSAHKQNTMGKTHCRPWMYIIKTGAAFAKKIFAKQQRCSQRSPQSRKYIRNIAIT